LEGVKPLASFLEVLFQILHHEVDSPALSVAHEATEHVAPDVKRHARMMIVMERAEAFMVTHVESKSLCDPLDRKVAELLKFILFHTI
jgi:hypothetical protein